MLFSNFTIKKTKAYFIPRTEQTLLATLFVLLWAYIIARACMVFYVHDELPTKWSFMINWDFLPYTGLVGANNHIVNSFLGGCFIRLFNSDAMWVVRLPNILAFPLFYWSLVGFRKYFKAVANFYLFFAPLVLSAFVIEFFGLARGYGLSMAFFTAALLQSFHFYDKQESVRGVLAVVFWILALYANLTLIPFAFIGSGYILVLQLKNRKWAFAIFPLLAYFLVGYAIKYSFHLKEVGRLYLGDQEGFFQTTLHSLTKQLWNTQHVLIDIVLVLVTLFIFLQLFFQVRKEKSILSTTLFIGFLYIAALANLVLQNVLFGINYPHTRGALYLIPLFFGALAFALDNWELKRIGIPVVILSLIFFVVDANFSFSKAYPFDHFDKELLTKIPSDVNGTPPTTGGRYWGMDSELMREYGFPYRAFQRSDDPADTLLDYLVNSTIYRSNIEQLYFPIYTDEISSLTLYQRKCFLSRVQLTEQTDTISGNKMYYNLYGDRFSNPLLLRFTGTIKGIDNFHEVSVVINSVDSLTNKTINYESFSLTYGCKLNDSGKVTFDFSYALKHQPIANYLKIYLYNPKQKELAGHVSCSTYLLSTCTER